jgi:hypothetical protein
MSHPTTSQSPNGHGKSFVPGGTYDSAGPGQLAQFEAAEHMKTTEAGKRVNNPCAPRPSVLYSNSFLPDMVTSKSVYGCSAMSPPYLATDMSSVEPACSACRGCSSGFNLSVFGYRPVSAPAYACGTPTAASVSGVESARGAVQLGVQPLSTVGVGSSSSPSRYGYGAALAAKESANSAMRSACSSGNASDCMTAARQAQHLNSTVASYGMVLPTQFLADATEFTGTFGGTRPGGF